MCDSNALVSAVMIFFNEERFLQEAIDSVFAQTYDSWKLLLVDDGSTDGSTAIARRMAHQYPGKVYYLEHENHQTRGMSASRNLALWNARGKYVSYLDGDDVWLPKKLEQQVAILESRPEAAMVYGPLLRWYSWTGNAKDLDRDDLYGLQANRVILRSDILVHPPNLLPLFFQHDQLIPAGILVKRDALLRIGGSEEIFHGNYEDAAVLVKLCLSHSVYVSSQCWYKYRQHPKSHTKRVRKAGESDRSQLFFLNWAKDYLAGQGVQNPEVWQALHQARHRVLWRLRHPELRRIADTCMTLYNRTERMIMYSGRHILTASLRHKLYSQWYKIK